MKRYSGKNEFDKKQVSTVTNLNNLYDDDMKFRMKEKLTKEREGKKKEIAFHSNGESRRLKNPNSQMGIF